MQAILMTGAALLFSVSATVSAPPVDLAQLAETARREADVPALGLVVLRGADAEIPAIGVNGVRVLGQDAAVTTDDVWHWGSITKSITATVVARLVERGVVDWDDTIEQRLGASVSELRDEYRSVTLTDLLAHRSGLPANIPIDRFAEFAGAPADPIADRLRWVRIALAQAPVGPKETTYAYSNQGYIVAGAMLEAATGETWETLCRREVFAPLGLTSAGFGPPGPEQPRGHTPKDGVDAPAPVDADNPPALGPAGRVHMSLADMARYLHAHATRRAGFLTEASYERLHTPQYDGNYACGWMKISADVRWHNGSNTMWYAEAMFDLADQTAAAVVVNDGDIASVQPTVRATLHALMRGAE